MAIATVSPLVSDVELLVKYPTKESVLTAIASGTLGIDAGMVILAAQAKKAAGPPEPKARRTAKGLLWIGLGYRRAKGVSNSACLSPAQWRAIVGLVKDGTIEGYLDHLDDVPLSASALATTKEGGAA